MSRKTNIFGCAAACVLLAYLLLLALVCMLYAGWLPGADRLLGGRHIHPLSHYVRHFSGLYAKASIGLAAAGALLSGLLAWIRMTGGWRRFLPRFIFLLCFTGLLAEMVLRMAFAMPGGRLPGLQNAELLGDPNTDDFYWVLAARLGGKVERDYVVPTRGWSQKRPTEENPLGLRPDTREAIARNQPHVYFYGDSFVHGMPFNTNTLPDMISVKSGRSVINLGVRGYGVDQMFLMAGEVGMPPQDSEVWVGILTWDLDRAYLEYSYGQKPRYRLVEGRLVLPNVPITRVDQEYVDSFRMPFRSWLIQAVRRQWQARQGLERSGPDKNEKIALNRAILTEWSKACRDAGVPMRVVLFHTRQDLAEESWRTQAIKDYCRELELPLFDTADALLPYLEKVGSWGDELFQEGDFHHTDLANELISDWLAKNWTVRTED